MQRTKDKSAILLHAYSRTVAVPKCASTNKFH